MSDSVIDVKHVYKQFSMGEVNVPVLNDVSLCVHREDFIAIMGPSGSGKSTLLYLIGGLDSPSSGTIEIKGKNISLLNDRQKSIVRRRDIGFVFQFFNLVPTLNVEENVLLPALLDGKTIRQCKERLEMILETVELAERRRHKPRELSGGQQQRVAIARALMNQPDIVLADELTGNLDSHTGNEVMELLHKVNSEHGVTILFVTHSQEAAVYAKNIIHLKDGRISR